MTRIATALVIAALAITAAFAENQPKPPENKLNEPPQAQPADPPETEIPEPPGAELPDLQDAEPPIPPPDVPERAQPATIEVKVDSIVVEPESRAPVIILTNPDRTTCLPIFVGEAEASAIWRYMNKIAAPRPMTHDLLAGVIEKFGGEVTSVTVTSIKRGVFYAVIEINAGGKTIEIDARPSDAIALALRLGVSVYVAEGVMQEAGHEPPPEREPEQEIPRQEPAPPEMPGPI